MVHRLLPFIDEHPEDLAAAYRELRPIRQLDVEVRLDWRCNAMCKFCGVWKYSREGMLPVEAWRQIFTDLAAAGLRFALFTGGEPLLYPHFLEVIGHVDELGVETSIITNGALLTQPRVEFLAGMQHLREIAVSLDSPDPAVHDEVRKLRGLFRRAVEGMTRIRTLAPHLSLTVNTVVAADTAATVKDLLKLPVLPDKIRVNPVGLDMKWLDSLVGVTENGWSAWASEAKTQAVSADVVASVRDELRHMRAEAERLGVMLEFERMDWEGPYQGVCVVPLAHLVLQPDGDVFPCCHVQDRANRIGRLSVQSVPEMFASLQYQSFLRRVRPVRLPACRSCSRYRDFNEHAVKLLPIGPAPKQ